jgi:hypothetical protein
VNQKEDNRDYQQDVEHPAQGRAGHQAEEPERQEQKDNEQHISPRARACKCHATWAVRDFSAMGA